MGGGGSGHHSSTHHHHTQLPAQQLPVQVGVDLQRTGRVPWPVPVLRAVLAALTLALAAGLGIGAVALRRGRGVLLEPLADVRALELAVVSVVGGRCDDDEGGEVRDAVLSGCLLVIVGGLR